MCTACNVIAREAAAAIFILPAPQLMRTGRNDCQPALWSGVFLNAKPLHASHYRSHNVVHTTVILTFLESDLGDLWDKKEGLRQILHTLVFSLSRLHRKKTRYTHLYKIPL